MDDFIEYLINFNSQIDTVLEYANYNQEYLEYLAEYSLQQINQVLEYAKFSENFWEEYL